MKHVMVCVLLFAGFVGTAMANEHVRNGMPCLSGICLGDEISALSHIKWNPVKVKSKPLSKYELDRIEKKFAPEARTAAQEIYPYLVENKFDNKVIPKLSKLKGFCKLHDMYGTFNSTNGFPTTVRLKVVSEAPGEEALKVTRITRRYPRETYTTAQREELHAQLKANYASIKKTSSMDDQWITWSYSGDILTLDYVVKDNKTGDFLTQTPGCGKALSID